MAEHDAVRRIRRVVDVLEDVLHVTGIADAHLVLFEGIRETGVFDLLRVHAHLGDFLETGEISVSGGRATVYLETKGSTIRKHVLLPP